MCPLYLFACEIEHNLYTISHKRWSMHLDAQLSMHVVSHTLFSREIARPSEGQTDSQRIRKAGLNFIIFYKRTGDVYEIHLGGPVEINTIYHFYIDFLS